MIAFFNSDTYNTLFNSFFDSQFYTNNRNQINEKFKYCIVNNQTSGYLGLINHINEQKTEYFKNFINDNIKDYTKIINAYNFLCYFVSKISVDIVKQPIQCQELQDIEGQLILDLLIDKKNLAKESVTKCHSV